MPRFRLSEIGSGTGGRWLGQDTFDWGPATNFDTRSTTDVVGGGVAGAEPPHKGGPNRPDRPELQWSVVREGALAATCLIVERAWFGLGQRYTIGSPGLRGTW